MTIAKQTRVAVLLGSYRSGSLNRRIAEHLRDHAPAGVTVDVIEGIVVDESANEGDPLANEAAVQRFLGARDALVAHEVEVAA